ncbi:MAG: response regulator [Desulfobulbaceae bacterium]|nr:response regulator [Desulfobulbaceae bacterium]
MQKTILIVDDSVMILRIVGLLLQQMGYAVLQAENGKVACKLAKEHLPDLVLMDIEMPKMDGIEATIRIKTLPSTSHIPIIFFTSLGSEEDIRNAKNAGGLAFLNKPICKEELQEAISKILSPETTP